MPRYLRTCCGEPAFDVSSAADLRDGVRTWLCSVCGAESREGEPCLARPGTAEKKAELARRAALSPELTTLFTAGDAPAEGAAPHSGQVPRQQHLRVDGDTMRCIFRQRRRWRVRIGRTGNRFIHVGLFETLEEAILARDAAEAKLAAQRSL